MYPESSYSNGNQEAKLNLGLEQYVALGDGLSNDLFPSIDSPPGAGAATLFAQDLSRRFGCPRHKNLSVPEATLGDIYRKQMPHLPDSREDVVVTITGGIADLVLIATETPGKSQIARPVDELVAGYGGMIKAIRRKLPAALIIVSNVPDPHGDWTYPNRTLAAWITRFNEQLRDTLIERANIVVADLHCELAGTRFFLEQSPRNPNALGAMAVCSAWRTALSCTDYVEAREVA